MQWFYSQTYQVIIEYNVLLQILVYNIERVFRLTFVGYLSCSLFIYLGNFTLNNTDQILYKPKCESVSNYFV